MRAAAIFDDRQARRISPAFFVAALVCFFFTFAGVSCNTQSAKSALQGISALGGSGSTVNESELDRCLAALENVNLISYSGFNLVFGSAPSVLTTAPAGCQQNGSASLPSSQSAVPSAGQVALGVQPLALSAFIALVLAIIAGALGILGLLRAPLRGLVATLLAMAGFITVLLEQSHLQGAIADKISAESAGAGAPFSIASFFNVDNGIAYVIVLAVLGLAALYNAAVAFFGTAETLEQANPPPDAEAPWTPPPQPEPSG